MPALRLFISHSSNLDETDASGRPLSKNWDLLEDTCQTIRSHYGEKIEILVDKKGLLPAMDWRARLDAWLGECDAAIILFSRRALTESNWVKYEASVLRWRSTRDPTFKLIPVLLEGQTAPKDLEKDIWETIRIADKQCIRSAANAADILTGLRSTLDERLNELDHAAEFGDRFSAIRALIEEYPNS